MWSTTEEPPAAVAFTLWCNPNKDDIMVAVYYGILVCCVANLALSILGIYKMLRDKQTHISFKISYIIINVSFVVSPPLYAFGIQSGWECWYDNFVRWNAQYVAALVFYLFGLSVLYLFWVLRIHHAFKGSALHVGKPAIIVMIAGFIMQLVTQPIISWYFIGFGWDPVARKKALDWFNVNTYTSIISSAIVLAVFIKKILQASVAVSSLKDLDRTDQEIKHKQIDQAMLSLIIRYSLLASIALMSTNAVSLYGIVKAQIPAWRMSLQMRGIHLFSQTFDQMINLICLYLQFPFGKTIYGKLCGGMQSCAQSCFIKCLRLEIHEPAEIVLATSIRDDVSSK